MIAMRARLGISISADAVRAVLVRRRGVAWHAEMQVEHADVETALASLLERAPASRFQRPGVTIAVGLAYCQLKPIDGLPAAASLTILNRVIQENSPAFFLCTGRRPIVTRVDRRADGTVWAAAFDPDVIDGALVALQRRGALAVAAVPSVVAVASLLPPGTHCIVDGALAAEITSTTATLVVGVRRIAVPVTETRIPLPAPVDALGARFAAAFGAAQSPAGMSFRWTPAPSEPRSRAVARARVAAAALLLTATLAGALVAPGTRATHAARTASRSLRGMREARVEATRLEGELRRVSSDIERLDQFASSRGEMTLLLGSIAQALPESTALLNLRVDSLEGSFIALSPRVTDILPLLARVRGIAAPRIVGSVTRETQGGVRLERATFRFSLPRRGRR